MKRHKYYTIYILIFILIVVLAILYYLHYFVFANKRENLEIIYPDNNVQKIQFKFYRDDEFKTSLPFYLHSECLFGILKNKLSLDIEFITSLDDLTSYNAKNTYVIIYTQNIYNNTLLWKDLINNNMNIIIINTEPNNTFLENHVKKQMENNTNNIDIVILDYIYDNIVNYQNLNINYMPFLWDDYLTQYYNSLLDAKIMRKNKDIDVLIFGRETERRKPIIDKLRTKYNVVDIRHVSHKEAINYLERSKIVLNIFSGEHGLGDKGKRYFDYFRLPLLFSNKIFVITETPEINENEQNLLGWEDIIPHAEFDDLEAMVDTYMQTNEEIIEDIVEKQYTWFIKHPFEYAVKDVFYNKINPPDAAVNAT